MAYRISRGTRIDAEVRRIAAEQFDGLIADLGDSNLSVGSQIHVSRKRCKRLRGLLRLVRPGVRAWYGPENAAIRDAARLLSPARDAAIRISTLAQLAQQETAAQGVDGATLHELHCWLAERRANNADEVDARIALASFHQRLEALRDRARHWRTKGNAARIVSGGFRRIYGAARSAYMQAKETPDAASFHRWRRRVKDHWCHLLLLDELWPTIVASHAKRVDELAGLLGKANDLAVLMKELPAACAGGGDAGALDRLASLIAANQQQLQSQALSLGGELFQVKPKRIGRPIWRLWRD